MRRLVLVGYDIAAPKRLRRIARVCEDFGDRIQKSVFVCELSRKDEAVLRARLHKELLASEDTVFLVDIGPSRYDDDLWDRIHTLGLKPEVALMRGLVF